MKIINTLQAKYTKIEAAEPTTLGIEHARHLIDVAMAIVKIEDERMHQDEFKTALTKLQEAMHWLQDK